MPPERVGETNFWRITEGETIPGTGIGDKPVEIRGPVTVRVTIPLTEEGPSDKVWIQMPDDSVVIADAKHFPPE